MTNRNYAFDLLRFLAAIVIAILHYHWEFVPQGYLCVEFFLVLSGFLIFKNRHRYYAQNFFSIALNKITSFYTYYLILIVLAILLHVHNGDISSLSYFLSNIFQVLLFIPYIFMGGGYTLPFGQVWFLPNWLVASLVLIYFLKMKCRSENIMIAIIFFVLFGLVWGATDFHGINLSVEKNIFCFTFGFFRALCDMTAGILFSKVSDALQIKNSFFMNLLVFLIISFLGYIFVLPVNASYDFVSIFLFGLLILLLNENRLSITGFFSELGKKLHVLTSLSLPVYIFHVPCMKFLHIIGLGNMTKYIPLYLLLTIVFAFLGARLEKLLSFMLSHFIAKNVASLATGLKQ